MKRDTVFVGTNRHLPKGWWKRRLKSTEAVSILEELPRKYYHYQIGSIYLFTNGLKWSVSMNYGIGQSISTDHEDLTTAILMLGEKAAKELKTKEELE